MYLNCNDTDGALVRDVPCGDSTDPCGMLYRQMVTSPISSTAIDGHGRYCLRFLKLNSILIDIDDKIMNY